LFRLTGFVVKIEQPSSSQGSIEGEVLTDDTGVRFKQDLTSFERQSDAPPTMSDRTVFLREFLRGPLRMASVVPSSPALAGQMVSALPEYGDPVVVELGPGTGAVTEAIQRRLAGRGRHISIELSAPLTTHISQRFPAVDTVNGDATILPAVLRARGLPHADHIISGLPWSAWNDQTLMDTLAATLNPAGVFVQCAFACTRWAPPARRLLTRMRTAFGEVLIARTVWRNLPPAFVYVCRRPRVSIPAGAQTSRF
jgi:phosphatidylethanolamine/phosphatidyl-N-methylethanolamine N-methyltransferase